MNHVPGYNNGRIFQKQSRREGYDCDTKQKNVTIERRWGFRFIERGKGRSDEKWRYL